MENGTQQSGIQFFGNFFRFLDSGDIFEIEPQGAFNVRVEGRGGQGGLPGNLIPCKNIHDFLCLGDGDGFGR